jgi:hypothetical protein
MTNAKTKAEGLSLRDLVLHGETHLPDLSRAAMLRSPQIDAVRKIVESGVGASAWAAGVESLEACAMRVLDLEVSDLIAWAWNTQSSIREAMKLTAEDPDKIENVPLVTHTIQSTHHPYIEISLGEKVIRTITFDLTTKIDLEGAVLTIQQGEIDSIKPGSCRGEVRLELGAATLISKEAGSFTLPGSLTLRRTRSAWPSHAEERRETEH